MDATLEAFGRLDILVNSAATVSPGDFLQLTEADWGGVFEQKLNGYARCLRYVIPPMRTRRRPSGTGACGTGSDWRTHLAPLRGRAGTRA